MKVFEKFATCKSVEDFRKAINDFCNQQTNCKTCVLASRNRENKEFYEDDDFCCANIVFKFLKSDIEEENKNEE